MLHINKNQTMGNTVSPYDEAKRQYDQNYALSARKSYGSGGSSGNSAEYSDTSPSLTFAQLNQIHDDAAEYAARSEDALNNYLGQMIAYGLSLEDAADIYESYFPNGDAEIVDTSVGVKSSVEAPSTGGRLDNRFKLEKFG